MITECEMQFLTHVCRLLLSFSPTLGAMCDGTVGAVLSLKAKWDGLIWCCGGPCGNQLCEYRLVPGFPFEVLVDLGWVNID